MNRAERRKRMKEKKILQMKPPDTSEPPVMPDFSGIPLATMCQSIQLLINELRSRGVKIYDFDHKSKCVELVQIIRGKVYFLTAEEGKPSGKV